MTPVTRAGWQGRAGPDWWWEEDAEGDGGHWDGFTASVFSSEGDGLGLERSNLCVGTAPNSLLPSTLLQQEMCEV